MPKGAAVSAGRSARSYLDKLRNRLASLPPETFPHVVDVTADVTAPDLGSRFEFAVAGLLDGV